MEDLPRICLELFDTIDSQLLASRGRDSHAEFKRQYTRLQSWCHEHGDRQGSVQAPASQDAGAEEITSVIQRHLRSLLNESRSRWHFHSAPMLTVCSCKGYLRRSGWSHTPK